MRLRNYLTLCLFGASSGAIDFLPPTHAFLTFYGVGTGPVMCMEQVMEMKFNEYVEGCASSFFNLRVEYIGSGEIQKLIYLRLIICYFDLISAI